MKPFKWKSESLQREAWRHALRRSYTATKAKILQKHKPDLDECDRLRAKMGRMDKRIEAIENKVANQADKKFGGWDVWRRDRKKLKIVVKEMDTASAMIRASKAALLRRMEELSEPYVKEIEELDQLQEQLLNES